MRHLMISLLAGTALAVSGCGQGGAAAETADAAVEIRVHKTPWCGCCGDWVKHLEAHGMAVTVVEHEDLTPVRSTLGVPPQMTSCHTAVVDGYTIEGHVPARDIERLLAERPAGVRGLAVPGMPVGSPGMESGDRLDPYDVMAFGDDGYHVFAQYRP